MSVPLSRRTVLKGVGCAMGLPLLEAMLPSRVFAAAEEKPPVRMAFISFPNGAIMDAWRPQGEDEAFQFGPTMQPLVELKSNISMTPEPGCKRPWSGRACRALRRCKVVASSAFCWG